MNNKLRTPIAVLVGALVIGGVIVFSGRPATTPATPSAGALNNVSMVDGKQIIVINVKGGYSPKKMTAKAGVPTVVRFTTNGTFDCSSAIRIPSLGISKTLPPSGTTEIDLGTPKVGPLQGLCVMGMYSFQIDFQE
jgi:plastocyanin domain-containing protein